MEDNRQIREFAAPKLSEWKGEPVNSSETINVMMLIPWMEMGGADKFNLDVIKLIDKSKFSVTVVCTVQAENVWRSQFEEFCQDLHVLPETHDVRDYAEKISELLMSRAIDVIFLSNAYYGYYVLPWVRYHFPHIAIVDYVHMAEWYWRSGGYARLSGVSGTFLDKTLVCNDATRGVMLDIFGRKEETVQTLYIGVDHKRFNPEIVPYGIIRKKYDIPENKKVILFPCRIHPQKRPFLMVEIAKRVVKKIENVCFFVAGDGPQYKDLLEAIKRESLQEFFVCPGEISEMETVYRDSDVTLICSLKEGLSLTAYESCAMMTPVITADVGGQKELINESMGRVVPMLQQEEDIDLREYSEKEINFYVTAIEEILQNEVLYQKLAKNCRTRIMEQFSVERMIRNLEKEFTEVIQKLKTEQPVVNEEMKGFAENYLATYVEFESSGNTLKYGQNMNEELKRIANSKLGKFAIQLMMKMKLNKIFH